MSRGKRRMNARRQRALIETLLVFAAALCFFRWQLAQWNGFLDFDGHYHLRVAHWIAHYGLWTDIPWLPFTVLGERGPDHHWLWHLMLLPFAWIDDPAQALLWAAAFNGAATVAVIALVMRLLGVPAAPLFALLAVTAATLMPYRLMMLRAQNVAVIFMMLALWAMVRERYKTLAALAFLFLESYHAAVILAPMALIGSAARCAEKRRLVLTPLIAVAAGATLALVVSPWFPRNVEYLMFHVLFKTANPAYGEQLSSLIGTEWYPTGWKNLWLQAWPAHVSLGMALVALGWRRFRDAAFRIPVDTFIAIGVALLSLALYHQAMRFAEYYVPFAALAAGLAARDVMPADGYARLRAAALLAWMLVAASVGLASLQAPRLMPAQHMAGVALRLNELGQAGDVVFNSSWSDFMALVWWADGFRYTNGLDGHYLAYRDPARFAIWLAASTGAIEDPAAAIALAFDARFAVVAREHAKLAKQLMQSPRAVLHITSPEGWLFELRR
jgi:hypothetical protein